MHQGLLSAAIATPAQLVPRGAVEGVAGGPYTDVVSAVSGFAIAAIVTYAIGRLLVLPAVVRVVAARNRNNPTIETAVQTYLHAFVVLLAFVAGIAGGGFGGLLTDLSIVAAALTLVVGASSQQVVGSLVSGLFLVADPDFNVGDWIGWPGGEGVVEAVDFRVTRIRTPNNETVTVPNTELTANALTRPYGRDRYRVTESFDVAYADDA